VKQCIIFLYLVNNLHLVQGVLSFGVIMNETTINIHVYLCQKSLLHNNNLWWVMAHTEHGTETLVAS
jgi:hypothetical protein